MNDFIPAAAPVVPQQTTDQQATIEFAKVAGDQRLIVLMQQSAQLSLFLPFKKIETLEQYDQAIDAFTASKKTIKDLETLRHSAVDYPTKLVKMINGLFKQIRDGIERSKNHLGLIINAKKQADDALAKAAEIEAEAKRQAAIDAGVPVIPEVIDAGDGVGEVQMEGNVIPVIPSNTVESARGAKVHTRKDIEVEVVDLKLFLKTLASKNQRYEWFTDEAESLIEVKIGPLKALHKANSAKKIPGLLFKTVTKTI